MFLVFFVVVAVDIFMKYIGARIVKVVWDIFGTFGLQCGICINPYKKRSRKLIPQVFRLLSS